MPGRFQQVRHHRAVGGAAPVADMQWAGGIGGDELHLHTFTRPQGAAPKCRLLIQYRPHHAMKGLWREKEIDKTRPGNLHFDHMRGIGQRARQRLGDLAWFAPRCPGEQQRGIAGEIAVLLIAGAFDDEIRIGVGWQATASLHGMQCLSDQCFEMVFHKQ